MPAQLLVQPLVRHSTLKTTFSGIPHALSTPEAPVHQYRGIKYATIPGRFQQSKLFSAYYSRTDATRFGPICPQPKGRTVEEELIDASEEDRPPQTFKQIESECLNLNITCPAGLTRDSRLPVMIWIHGGGNRGSGSHWLYDGGALVQNSMRLGKPVVLVTINYRLGILGFAASPELLTDNNKASDHPTSDGVGNYGLRDQERALEWVNHFILDFGGDPSNVTLFGSGTGASDILFHMHSSTNLTTPSLRLFHRAIAHSPLIEPTVPTVEAAGVQLQRVMSILKVETVDELRRVQVEKMVFIAGEKIGRAVDDGVWLAGGWRERMFPEEFKHSRGSISQGRSYGYGRRGSRGTTSFSLTAHTIMDDTSTKLLHITSHNHPPNGQQQVPSSSPSRPTLQPVIIGDTGFESFLYSVPASMWTPASVTRRLKAICGSLTKASGLLRAYDISDHTAEEDLPEKVLDLINDARVAWMVESMARALSGPKVEVGNTAILSSTKAGKEARDGGVWRYVFDQEAPKRGTPHHAADLIYLFDTARPPSFADLSGTGGDIGGSSSSTSSTLYDAFDSYDSFPDSFSDSGDEDSFDDGGLDENWGVPIVTPWNYIHIRDTLQLRWLSFAYGEAPWTESREGDGKVFVFGPEGETGERSARIFEGRRRKGHWKRGLEPLEREVVGRIAAELGNGPVSNVGAQVEEGWEEGW